MATCMQGLPPSRLGEPAVPPSPPLRAPTEPALQVHKPRLPRPLGLPANRGRDRVGLTVSARVKELDPVLDPAHTESGNRVEILRAGDAGTCVSVSGGTGRVALLEVRRQGGLCDIVRQRVEGAEDG